LRLMARPLQVLRGFQPARHPALLMGADGREGNHTVSRELLSAVPSVVGSNRIDGPCWAAIGRRHFPAGTKPPCAHEVLPDEIARSQWCGSGVVAGADKRAAGLRQHHVYRIVRLVGGDNRRAEAVERGNARSRDVRRSSRHPPPCHRCAARAMWFRISGRETDRSRAPNVKATPYTTVIFTLQRAESAPGCRRGLFVSRRFLP
jgi:hypothetical protein